MARASGIRGCNGKFADILQRNSGDLSLLLEKDEKRTCGTGLENSLA
jgi:hypothetical protein